MTFRVKIISPIKVDEADLRRRQIRYLVGELEDLLPDLQDQASLESPSRIHRRGGDSLASIDQ